MPTKSARHTASKSASQAAAKKAVSCAAKNPKKPTKQAAKASVKATTTVKAAKSVAASTTSAKPKVAAQAAAKQSRTAQTLSSAKPAATKPAAKTVQPPTKTVSAKSVSSATVVKPTTRSRDEAAALQAFQAAYKHFGRGRFAEARDMFRALLAKFPGVAEVSARSRTYLSIAERRLESEKSLPTDFAGLYNRAVIELNRGDLIAARNYFELALRRESDSPDAAYAHYGLAAIYARQSETQSALDALQKALTIEPALRRRAQHDSDFQTLRTEADFETLIFSHRHE